MTLLRSLAFNLWLYAMTTGLSLWLALSGADRPALLAGARAWSRLALGGLRLLCGIDYVVTGRDNLPAEGAALVAPMHQSAFDTMLWLQLVPECVYVLKRELTVIPVFGRLLRRSGMIAVNRRAGASAMRELLRQADAALRQGRQIVIFPEGTRVAPGSRARLQPGVAALATRSGLPVIPAVTDSGIVWGRRAFRKRRGTIRLEILPALPAGLARDQLMARLAETYATGYAALRARAAVDKSVGGAASQFRDQPNGLS
jgi:1-acyl-sn-glycerol-3-phosphate acyltransferase